MKAEESQNIFPVVGIGASAGGLEALRTFLEHTPTDCDLAFVIVVHLSPDHQSHLAELLQTHTEMPVTQVNEAVTIERNHVYVIPPNRNLSSIDSHLRLTPLEQSRSQRAPIDHFFRTVARSHGELPIGVVLTGGGSDGAVGLKDIKEVGGLVLAQEPEEAAFDSMPQSAIATGIVDAILPVAEMGPQIKAYVQHALVLQIPAVDSELDREERALLQKIFVHLRSVAGHDFSRYKRGTILRRLRRRMQLRGLATLAAYLETLRREPDETQALYSDLLIVVTNFFREPETYQVLVEKVISPLVAEQPDDDPIRVWTPGCATGEEAYSLAILFMEEAQRQEKPVALQIFATDISEDALRVARNGLYSTAIEADVSPERLKRFFRKEQDGYRVREEVREHVLFAQHSLLKDPPFSRVDLISCRNVLIYLQRELQQQIFELFHYALKTQGFLFLGSSEGVDDPRLFSPVSARHSLYRRQEVTTVPPRLPVLPFAVSEEHDRIEKTGKRRAHSYGQQHQQLAERYAPPSVLIDEDHTVLHISENAGRYLRVPGGETTNNLIQLVREEMRIDLTTLLHRAFSKNRPSRSNPIEVAFNGESALVTLYVQPRTEDTEKHLALVYFLESELPEELETATSGPVSPAGLVRELQEDLAETKRQLRATIEEYEASKEEMKASNEELQSINEELRSMTEELETSKEELQSMNEELITVNEENRHKVEELSQLSSDLQNLLAATDIATLFLDSQLHIQRFTPAASELFNIRHTDRERPLAHLTHRLIGYDDLLLDARRVLQEFNPIEREVQSEAGRHYLLRLLPYRTMRDEVDGVVITLVDITTLRQTEQALQTSRERYRLLVENTREYAMLTMDEEGHIDTWNQGAQRTLGYDDQEVIGRSGSIIFTPEDREVGAPERELKHARQEGQAIDERWHLRKDGSRFWGSGVVTSLWDQDGHLRGYAKVLRDNTARKQAEEALRERERELMSLTERLEERVQERTRQVRQLASELVTSEQKVRHRISRVLHDDLQQMLYALEMQMELFRREADQVLEDQQRHALDEMSGVIDDSVRVTRQLTVELSPPVLRGEGLTEALQWLANHMRDVFGLEVNIDASTSPSINDEDQRILLFQLVRELLFNVVKHAGVKEAHVRLARENDDIRITVADRGHGFNVEQALAQAQRDGFGLYYMHERLELFGGHADVDSQPGQGTRVTLFLPDNATHDDGEYGRGAEV